jgi:hypothetical protein
MPLPLNRAELLEFIAQRIGLNSSLEIDASTLKMLNKHINKYIIQFDMSFSEFGYIIFYYTEVMNKKIETLYGLSFVERIYREAHTAFLKQQEANQQQTEDAKIAAEVIGNPKIINIKYTDKKPVPRKARQLSYDTIVLEEVKDGDSED